VKRLPAETVAMVAAAVLVVGLAATRTQLAPTEARSASTHFSGKGGLRALFLTAKELGIPVTRWQLPIDDCRDCPSFAIVAPATPLRSDEAKALRKRLEDGARVLYVPPIGDVTLLDRVGLSLRPSRDEATVRAVGGSAWLEGLPTRVRGFRQMLVRQGVGPDDVFVAPLLARGSRRFGAARVLVGNGELVVIADVAPLENASLRGADVAPLALRAMAALAGDDGIAFDEYHHGFDDRAGLWRTSARWLASTAPGWAILQLAAIAVLATAAAGVRLGSPRDPAPASGRSPLEHADALAAAYTAARATRRAAVLLVDELRLRLGVRSPAGLRARLDAIAATRPALRPAVADVVRHAEGQSDPDLPRLARAIDLIADQLMEEPHAVSP
jgi:hypothetical protein